MKKVCAWCLKELGKISDSRYQDNVITSGICNECAEHFVANKPGRKIKEFLDSIELPIFVVNSKFQVQTANKSALNMLKKDIEQVGGYFGGDAMECAYARLPGGCGKTEHCNACTIRKTVAESHATGKRIVKRTALEDIKTSNGVMKMRYIITTEKIKDVVLLRIDEANQV